MPSNNAKYTPELRDCTICDRERKVIDECCRRNRNRQEHGVQLGKLSIMHNLLMEIITRDINYGRITVYTIHWMC